MLFRWIPVPGTTRPLPEPSEDERDAASPWPSTTLMCVVPPTASARARRRLRLHRPCHRERRRLGVAERLEADREQPAAARRRRVRAELAPPVAHLERLALDHPVGGEILEGDGDVRGDPLRELAAVEALGTLAASRSIVSASSGTTKRSPPQRATRPVQRVAFGRGPEERIEDPVQVGLRLVEDDALAGEARGGREQLGQRHAAERGAPPRARARFPARQRRRGPCEELPRVVVEVDRQTSTSSDGAAERSGSATKKSRRWRARLPRRGRAGSRHRPGR